MIGEANFRKECGRLLQEFKAAVARSNAATADLENAIVTYVRSQACAAAAEEEANAAVAASRGAIGRASALPSLKNADAKLSAATAGLKMAYAAVTEARDHATQAAEAAKLLQKLLEPYKEVALAIN